jgi:hypothetical protein
LKEQQCLLRLSDDVAKFAYGQKSIKFINLGVNEKVISQFLVLSRPA